MINICPECKSSNINIYIGYSYQCEKMDCNNCGSVFYKEIDSKNMVKFTQDLFQLGNFTLNSGQKSKWKIECDALTETDIVTLSALIRQMVGPYSSVEGVPTGGLRLAKELEKYVSINGPHLVVDDVYITGKSILKILNDRNSSGKQSVGAVIFARGQIKTCLIKAIFEMPECFWLEPRKR